MNIHGEQEPAGTVIFDLDGTLLDTLEDLRSAVNHVLRAHNFPERSIEETMAFVGNVVGVLIDKACPDGTPAEVSSQLLKEFKQWYFEHVLEQTAPYEGIPELLEKCQAAGIRTAVVSNKFETAVQSLCDSTLPGLLDLCVGDLPEYPRKPDPANVYRCMRGLGVSDPAKVIYVGDSETDICTARNAGLPMIIVTWGFRERSLLEACGGENLVDTSEALWLKIRELLHM